MRLTASGAYSRPAPVPKMPPGLVQLMEGLARDVLKHNPTDVEEFCARHVEQLLIIRDGQAPTKRHLTLEQKIKRAQEKVRQKAEQRRRMYDEEMKKFHDVIEAGALSAAVEETEEMSGINKKDKIITEEVKSATESKTETKLKAPVHHDKDLAKALEVEIFHKPVEEVRPFIIGEKTNIDEIEEDSKEIIGNRNPFHQMKNNEEIYSPKLNEIVTFDEIDAKGPSEQAFIEETKTDDSHSRSRRSVILESGEKGEEETGDENKDVEVVEEQKNENENADKSKEKEDHHDLNEPTTTSAPPEPNKNTSEADVEVNISHMAVEQNIESKELVAAQVTNEIITKPVTVSNDNTSEADYKDKTANAAEVQNPESKELVEALASNEITPALNEDKISNTAKAENTEIKELVDAQASNKNNTNPAPAPYENTLVAEIFIIAADKTEELKEDAENIFVSAQPLNENSEIYDKDENITGAEIKHEILLNEETKIDKATVFANEVSTPAASSKVNDISEMQINNDNAQRGVEVTIKPSALQNIDIDIVSSTDDKPITNEEKTLSNEASKGLEEKDNEQNLEIISNTEESYTKKENDLEEIITSNENKNMKESEQNSVNNNMAAIQVDEASGKETKEVKLATESKQNGSDVTIISKKSENEQTEVLADNDEKIIDAVEKLEVLSGPIAYENDNIQSIESTPEVTEKESVQNFQTVNVKESVDEENSGKAITTVDKVLVEEPAEINDDNDSAPEPQLVGINTGNTVHENGTPELHINDTTIENGTESLEQDITIDTRPDQDIQRENITITEVHDDVTPNSENTKTDIETSSVGKSSSMDDSYIDEGDSITEVNDSRKGAVTERKQEASGMDLETAAVTIQKVFRTFLFKSRESTFDDPGIEGNDSIEGDSEKTEVEFPVTSAALNKERRTLGISRMDTVLQTVNEEKSLSLSTDDSSLSSAATIIQAHVRGFLTRNRLNSNKTNSSSLVNSDGVPSSTSLDNDSEQKVNKTVLNIHIVPEGEHFLSRDESLLTSMELSLDGSPPSSTNLHPLGYDKSEPRKQLKREDAIQSISPPSNNSDKLSEDVDSVKDMPINDTEQQKKDFKDEPSQDVVMDRDDTPTKSTTIETVIEAHKIIKDVSSSPEPEKEDVDTAVRRKRSINLSSDEGDVVTPFEDRMSTGSDATSRLLHSGEFHDVVLPTKVLRGDTTAVREFKNVLVYFLIWNNNHAL